MTMPEKTTGELLEDIDRRAGLLYEELQAETKARRLWIGLCAALAVLSLASTTALGVVLSKYVEQGDRLDSLFDLQQADTAQRRVDACLADNQQRAAGRAQVDLSTKSAQISVTALAAPELRSPSRGPRTPEQEADLDRLLKVYTEIYLRDTAELREEVLKNLQPRDCSPAVVNAPRVPGAAPTTQPTVTTAPTPSSTAVPPPPATDG